METDFLKVDKTSCRGRFPSYNKPTAVGYFSLDGEREYCSDFSQMKYVRLSTNLTDDSATCSVNFDLDKGRTNAIKKLDVHEKLDNIFKWISERTKNKETFDADIVCYRGLLTLLMCTPYEKQEGWIICATRFQGILYLCEYETEQKKQRREEMTDRDKQFYSWGYKFEQYMCSDKPNGTPDPQPPVNEREEFCVMFTTKLNGLRLLFGAEMDGVLDHSEIKDVADLAEANFVELKTSRKIENNRQFNNFKRFKLVKWWSQSFLVGIEHLVCGFRNDMGIVQTLEKFHVLKIPRKAENAWEPNICMNFCARFLDFANHLVREEDPNTVWKFQCQPYESVRAIKIDGPSEYSFLPEWFMGISKIPSKNVLPE